MKDLLQRLLGLQRWALLATGAVAAAFSVHAAPPINTLTPGVVFEGRGDVAILGHDPVAYFTLMKAVKGRDEFTYPWMGAKWKFATAAHLEAFKADPQRYAPQYGGYCAYGTAQGYLVKVDPTQFSIIDGKLYLNYDASVQARWLKDTAGYISAADAKFPGLLAKP